MKDISNRLIGFLEEHISRKLSVAPLMHLSSESNKMLSDLFEKMIEAERQFKAAKINEKWISFENTKIPKGIDYNYSPEIAKEKIEDASKFGCIFSFKLKGRDIQISINFSKTTDNNSKYCNEAIKRIYMWLYLSTHYASAACSQKLNIYIYLTELKKKLPTANSHIKQEHANSAFTTTCDSESEIHIYREEEWFKVLIHETFHNMGLDFSAMNNAKINHCILAIFPIKTTQQRFFESYCEMWAEILNVMFISYLSTRAHNTIETMIKKTMKMLKVERDFSLLQCVKVLNNLSLEYEDLYGTTPAAEHARMHKYKESTPVFAYYVLKSIMMFYVSDYIHWCAIQNGGSLQFAHFDKNLTEYCSFIREHYKRDEYLKSIKIVEKALAHCKHSSEMDEHTREVLTTLRMSVHEIA